MEDQIQDVPEVEAVEPKRRGRPRKTATDDPLPQVSLSFEQLKDLLAMAQSDKAPSAELQAAILGLNATIDASKKLTQGIERTVRRSNAEGQDVSVFNFKAGCEHCTNNTPHPETGKLGHPKPALLYETYFPNGAKVVGEDCTITEIELFNAFTGSKTARDGKWTATLTRKGGKGRLIVDAPSYSLDQRAELPPLVQILMELLHGAHAADPAHLFDQVQALNARIAELEAKSVPVPA